MVGIVIPVKVTRVGRGGGVEALDCSFWVIKCDKNFSVHQQTQRGLCVNYFLHSFHVKFSQLNLNGK